MVALACFAQAPVSAAIAKMHMDRPLGNHLNHIRDIILLNLHLFSNLEELRSYAIAQLAQSGVAYVLEPWSREDRPTADWAHSRDFYRWLLEDPRCPEWLRRDCVWATLGSDN
jgi:hypothetical protein